MTSLLEFREKLKLVYSKNEIFIVPIVKFLVAFAALSMVNGQLGYMTKLDNIAIILILSLFCSFLPSGCMILFTAAFSLLHLYALSMEVALVGLCVYLVMFLLFFRFSPKNSLVIVLTPMLFVLKIPYVIPIAMGLIGAPAAAISVGCGVLIYYFLNNVVNSATTIRTMGAEEATAKLRMVIDGLLNNKEMIVVAAAFAVTVIVVYLIRRMSIDYAWTIAMIAGVIINLVILLVGDLLYDTNMSVLNAVLGSLVAIVVAKLIEFFRFCVDYSRTEKVQFEDDEYYYYVKAIPKMTVAAQTKTVKRINTQIQPSSDYDSEGVNTQRVRSVVTEHDSLSTSQQTRKSDNGRNRTERSASGGAASNIAENNDTYRRKTSVERSEYEKSTLAGKRAAEGRNGSAARSSLNRSDTGGSGLLEGRNSVTSRNTADNSSTRSRNGAGNSGLTGSKYTAGSGTQAGGRTNTSSSAENNAYAGTRSTSGTNRLSENRSSIGNRSTSGTNGTRSTGGNRSQTGYGNTTNDRSTTGNSGYNRKK